MAHPVYQQTDGYIVNSADKTTNVKYVADALLVRRMSWKRNAIVTGGAAFTVAAVTAV